MRTVRIFKSADLKTVRTAHPTAEGYGNNNDIPMRRTPLARQPGRFQPALE
ncbi:hypothetical protein [Undibacterium sp. Tian12W]|uniref:hypothetical protein n=1 Tax=Undibacterium sp. Tian12W TaxID=3413054 RepID=UPI003BF5B9D3